MTKTNAMRILDKAKISYETAEYTVDENDLSGIHVAEQVGFPPEQTFKTIVAKGDKTGFIVMCVPVNTEIDLKKAAVVSGNKKIEMVAVKNLLSITGYIRGGCSPIGMKKQFPTYFDETAVLYDKIALSAGVRGCQLILNPNELIDFIKAEIYDITVI
jgi:Cys-tRNA(Pro)/Cys-tRNA(Cys) deacylase